MTADHFEYPTDAACAGHPHSQWWDAGVVGEPAEERGWRHEAALYVCNRKCPVREGCEAAIDPRYDEGVRAGRVLKPLAQVGGYGEVQGVVRRRKAS